MCVCVWRGGWERLCVCIGVESGEGGGDHVHVCAEGRLYAFVFRGRGGSGGRKRREERG